MIIKKKISVCFSCIFRAKIGKYISCYFFFFSCENLTFVRLFHFTAFFSDTVRVRVYDILLTIAVVSVRKPFDFMYTGCTADYTWSTNANSAGGGISLVPFQSTSSRKTVPTHRRIIIRCDF